MSTTTHHAGPEDVLRQRLTYVAGVVGRSNLAEYIAGCDAEGLASLRRYLLNAIDLRVFALNEARRALVP